MFARLPLELRGQRRDWLPGPPEVFGVAYGGEEIRKRRVVHVRAVPPDISSAEYMLDVLSEGLDHETRRDGDLIWMAWEIEGSVGLWWASLDGHWIFGASAPVDEFQVLLEYVLAALDQ